MAMSQRRSDLFCSPSLVSRLLTLASELQRGRHTSSDASSGSKLAPFEDPSSIFSLREGSFNTSNWKIVDSRRFGIHNSTLSFSSRKVLQVLQRKGFQAYLVGGCVRDLILRRKPKDFDVVTTANLKQIKEQFNRCRVIGRKFPICQVCISGSMVEVSSFETVPMGANKRRKFQLSQMPKSCDKKDFVRWKDSMRRDFTVNGLLFDPFVHTIYDYVDGIKDIKASKLRTVIPARLSFKEDCARILRGLRIVARLGLQFSRETAAALEDLSPSIMTLSKDRLMMELNFMMAYGAAEPSIYFLQKYKILDVLLPFQASYLSDQTKNQSAGSSIMLMKLLSHLDKLLAADRPCSCTLWLGLLVFHLALVNHPQSALVIWTFSSILYLGTWKRALKFVRENNIGHVHFVPEILTPLGTESDEVILEEASYFVSLVKSSVNTFTSSEALLKSLARYSMTSPSSRFDVFFSKKVGKDVANLFDGMVKDIKSYDRKREMGDINYELLKKGDADETRFVLGKIIFDTMNSELIHQQRQESLMDTKPIHQRGQKSLEDTEIIHQQLKSHEDAELSHQQRHKIPEDKKSIHQQKQKSLEDTEYINQQGQRSLEDTLIPKLEKSLEKKEVILQQSQILSEETEPIHQLSQKSLEDTDLIHLERQNSLEDTRKLVHVRQKNQSSPATDKFQRPLSALFK
ncbi:putative poly(A) polymerase I [Iris pallida]|uniref:Poly(A) polymerase I n=1 Tax=Iris pallida TaxID=29817 RepID=A0AAX6GKW0_IRIPA|nr:putative poly(A) polymerase I [Iris pallida]